MKRNICYLLALFALTSMNQVKADPFAGEVGANIRGYEAGAFNTMEQSQKNNYQLEKSYVQSLDHLSNDERIYDAGVEEDVAREGMLYNPHFLLEKINFEVIARQS